MAATQDARLTAAIARFRAFFDELRAGFSERGDVLAQVALALLAKEHVLIAGPPGTAKSQLASAVLGRIVCEQTGTASLYARQITESTVQTDLIGPIDFKNLTETGRTMHFTDEGMLGNVHAFLDEVFDGRDMLLRSALNLLQEREVKQGGTITKGRIECALMTSNRYIAEVLEQSRETLLAFIDRIAFVGFVPRGFAEPSNLGAVLRRNVGGAGRARFDALLTIQDLDVLQAAVEEIYVAPEVCDGLAVFLGNLDAELAAATRADPAFVPTRYISTRTAVRCGNLLRAACMFDRVFHNHDRGDEVIGRDISLLRLHLLLSGPTPEQTQKLLAREVDPIERRQLTILRTEREIFEACFSKLPTITPSRRPRPVTTKPKAPQTSPPSPAQPPRPGEPAPPAVVTPADVLGQLEREIAGAHAEMDAKKLLALASSVSEYARDGAPEAARARGLLERAARAASVVGLAKTLDTTAAHERPLEAVRGIVDLARSLSDGTASMHATSRWMHERALEIIGDAALYAARGDGKMLDVAAQGIPIDAMEATSTRLSFLLELATIRKELMAHAASRVGTEPEEQPWTKALDHVERALVAWWSRSFALAMKDAAVSAQGLGGVLRALEPELRRLDVVDEQLAEITNRPRSIKRRVAGDRLGDLVRAALEGTDADDRPALVRQIKELLEVLAKNDLRGAIRPEAWLEWTARTLVSRDAIAKRDAPPPSQRPCDLDGYRRLRARGRRIAVTCTLAEVALVAAVDDPTISGADVAASALLGVLPEAVKAEVAEVDIGRIERAIDYLERWLASLMGATIEDTASSKLFELLWEEAALARFSMEVRLVEELLPESHERAKKLRWRIDALNERARSRSVELMEIKSDEIWHRK